MNLQVVESMVLKDIKTGLKIVNLTISALSLNQTKQKHTLRELKLKQER